MPESQPGRHLTQEQLLLLVNMAKKVNSSLNLDEILQFAIQSAQDICRCEASSILLKDEKTGELLFRVAEGSEGEKVKEIRLSPGQGIAGHVVNTGESLLIEDVYNDPRFCASVDSETGFKTKSMICVPLQGREEKTIGCLQVINRTDGVPFSKEEIQLCEAVAAEAAVAIDNARLVEATLEGERLAVIGQSIVGVAHCVKNILNGMEGGGFILEQGLKKDQIESIEKGWDMLKRHKVRLKDLVLEMLYVSKKREPELAPTDVAGILRDACELAGERAREKNVCLTVRVPDESQPILADGNILFRCILNLIGNAIDACMGVEGASVDVAMDEDPSGLLITLAVSDNGPGFPPEIRKRPFLPFQSTKGNKGTGLGLYTTKQMIEAQGGAIRLEDRPEGGAQVVISLLRREAPAGTAPKAAAETE